jgi:hypothetical protein
VIFVAGSRDYYMKRSLVILFIIVAIVLASCVHLLKLPPEPAIEFRSFTLFDTIDILGNPAQAGKLTFYFEDGDGDLGLDAPDTGSYSTGTNMFFKLFRKDNGTFELVTPSDPLYPSEYRIPYLDNQGQNKILRGTIDVTIIYFFYSQHDTLYYDFWIRDRAGHDSNTASTCIFVLGENGTCSK